MVSGSVNYSFSELGRRFLGFRSRFNPFYGFGLGLLLVSFIRVSVWVYSFQGFGLRGPFTPFRDRAFSFWGFGLGLLRLKLRPGGFGLGLLFSGLWPGFDRFGGFGFLSSLPFACFRVSGWVYSFFVLDLVSLGFRSGFALFRA